MGVQQPLKSALNVPLLCQMLVPPWQHFLSVWVTDVNGGKSGATGAWDTSSLTKHRGTLQHTRRDTTVLVPWLWWLKCIRKLKRNKNGKAIGLAAGDVDSGLLVIAHTYMLRPSALECATVDMQHLCMISISSRTASTTSN